MLNIMFKIELTRWREFSRIISDESLSGEIGARSEDDDRTRKSWKKINLLFCFRFIALWAQIVFFKSIQIVKSNSKKDVVYV
jgi:hypothetical protein